MKCMKQKALAGFDPTGHSGIYIQSRRYQFRSLVPRSLHATALRPAKEMNKAILALLLLTPLLVFGQRSELSKKYPEVDLANELHGTVFTPLKDIDFFKEFSLEGHTLTWPNGADFAPDFVHLSSKQIKTA